MNKSQIIRGLFATALALLGTVFVLLAGPSPSTPLNQLVSSLGFALIVSGIAAIFREAFLLRSETEEASEATAKRVHQELLRFPPGANGLRRVAAVRRGFEGYYTWVTKSEPQFLFFAGRSVLHRVQHDLQARALGSADAALARKLVEGSKITILFLDPRSSIIERLAEEEGQTHKQMLMDIAITLGICKRLCSYLNDHTVNPHAELYVRVYDEVPYFAYHREDDKIIVGFYFATALGSQSAAFEVLDADTGIFFEKHFESIFYRATGTALMALSAKLPELMFDEELYGDLLKMLVIHLGQEKVDRLIAGPRD